MLQFLLICSIQSRSLFTLLPCLVPHLLHPSIPVLVSVFVTNAQGIGCYPGSTNDPEPGRCRRTDGKKWRCSRDAFGDQKYCERHISKGRHRSRKPVEANKVVTTNSNAAAAASSANVRGKELDSVHLIS
ncbi:Growth-regulating factor 2 [Linum perenne]